MRKEFKKRENCEQSSMTAERITKLNNLGFDWAVITEKVPWAIRLREFYQICGHCRVPQKHPQNPSLGNWMSTIRTKFKKRENDEQSSMTAERIAERNNLGFEWVVSREKFQLTTKSTSSKYHQLNNNKQDKEKPPIFQDQRRQQHWHQQNQQGTKEISPGFPFCSSVEGGETFLDVSEESEGQKDQSTRTPQHQHQPQPASPEGVLPYPYQQYFIKSGEASYWI